MTSTTLARVAQNYLPMYISRETQPTGLWAVYSPNTLVQASTQLQPRYKQGEQKLSARRQAVETLTLWGASKGGGIP